MYNLEEELKNLKKEFQTFRNLMLRNPENTRFDNSLGINFSIINRDIIPYDYTILKDRDIICNTVDIKLQYYKEQEGYVIVSDDYRSYLHPNYIELQWTML